MANIRAGLTACACAAWLAGAPVAFGADLDFIQVSSEAKRYFVHSQATLDAPIQEVYDTLVDFDNYERFSSVYHDAKWLTQNDDGSGEIYTYTRGCVMFFCKGFKRVETVTVVPNTEIVTVVDAARSDARHGISTWALEAQDDRTVIIFKLEFEPKFWVPPVIGPYMLKRMLRKGGKDAIQRIEVLAIERVNGTTAAVDER